MGAKIAFVLIVLGIVGFTLYRFGLLQNVLYQQPKQAISVTPTPQPLIPKANPIIEATEEETSTQSGSIILINPPQEATAGQALVLSWFVKSDSTATASSTAIRYGRISQPHAKISSDYPEKTTIYQGTVSATFSAQLIIALPGTYYYRAHALVNNSNLWSPENVLIVKDASAVATPSR